MRTALKFLILLVAWAAAFWLAGCHWPGVDKGTHATPPPQYVVPPASSWVPPQPPMPPPAQFSAVAIPQVVIVPPVQRVRLDYGQVPMPFWDIQRTKDFKVWETVLRNCNPPPTDARADLWVTNTGGRWFYRAVGHTEAWPMDLVWAYTNKMGGP